ncbi:WecB/TagA/CpsF family glycosyltransferase [Patescibacteria group bacterium]|nr:WecB/TagA/CpsF family glycosyltransferase [Patescibacteria group bacterium]MBU4512966.1 WecB/TagA/CpsF family glycosyltransferase [Patescibacteria group bacterium]MCG2693002.1 WecB/TagA/CpsF family glycosyltransferase [Candidatus Parcubacteria bacterium]
MKPTILGVQIDNLSRTEVLRKIEHFLNSEEQHYIVTPNPEFIVAAQKDQEFTKILNKADIAIPDGMGLKIAARILHKQKINRLAGVDLMIKICKLAAQKNKSIYLFGAGEGVAKKAVNKLKQKFPELKIAGAHSGGIINYQLSIINPKLNNSQNIAKIKSANPDIILVALGQVKQEKWIVQNLPKLPSVRLAMGVGGSFDYISKKTPRAPKFLRILGLEWLVRLILQPKRIKRIWNATAVFMWLVLKEKLTK